MLTRIKIIGSAVAVACALAAAQSAPPVHAAQTASGASSLEGKGWPWPLIGEVVTAYRNGDDPYATGQHRGVDIAAPVGTPARAVVAGSVSFSGRLPDGGNAVTLRTHDGEYLVSYLHLATRGVKRGDPVVAGATLGAVGTTGKRSIEPPHLHFSVRVAGTRTYIDPMSLLGEPRPATPITGKPAPAEASRPTTERAADKPVKVVPLEEAARTRAITPREHADRAAKVGRPAAGVRDVVERPIAARSDRSSVRAPEPIVLETEAADEARSDAERVVDTPKSADARPPAAQPAQEEGAPLRAILFALAALALIGLFANRRPRAKSGTSHPPQSPPTETNDDADVVTLDAIRPPLSREAHGGARGHRP